MVHTRLFLAMAAAMATVVSAAPEGGLSKGGQTCADMQPILQCDDPFMLAYSSHSYNPISDFEINDYFHFLNEEPNKSLTWFYLTIDNPGKIKIKIEEANGIRYLIWGPFDDPKDAITKCTEGIPIDLIVDCNPELRDDTKYPNIGNALAGETYVVVIDNWNNCDYYFTLEKLGDATTACPSDFINPSPTPKPSVQPIIPSPVWSIDPPVEYAPIDPPVEYAPSDQPVAYAPSDQPVAYAPSDQPVAYAPSDQPVAYAPSDQPVAYAPSDQPVAYAPIDPPVAYAPIDPPVAYAPIDPPVEYATTDLGPTTIEGCRAIAGHKFRRGNRTVKDIDCEQCDPERKDGRRKKNRRLKTDGRRKTKWMCKQSTQPPVCQGNCGFDLVDPA